MSSHIEFDALLLAGGLSSRMKRDKAELIMGSKTLLECQKHKLYEAGARRVLVSRNDNQPESLADLYPNQGPLGGIYTGLMHTERDLLIAPVDMPLLDEALLNLLARAGTRDNVAMHYQDFLLPLFLPNNGETRNYIKQVLQNNGPRSIRSLLTKIGSQCLMTNRPQAFINVNTPKQWQALNTA